MRDYSLKIRELSVRAVSVPLETPHKTAAGVITEAPLVLIDVLTEQGIVGHSYVFCYTSKALEPTLLFIKALEPLIVGHAAEPVEIERLLDRHLRLLGPQGLVRTGMAAIDMAVWDVLARACRLPLARLLGGTLRSIPAYGAIGYDGAVQSARAASDWIKRGFRAVKLKIGYPDVREDLEVIRAVRSAVGDGISLMVDY